MPKSMAVEYLSEQNVELLMRLLGKMTHRPPFQRLTGAVLTLKDGHKALCDSRDEAAILASVDSMPRALYEIANWRPVVLRAYLAYRSGDEETLQASMDELGDLLPDEWKPELAASDGPIPRVVYTSGHAPPPQDTPGRSGQGATGEDV